MDKAAMDAAIAKASELSAEAVVKALGTNAKSGLSESAIAERREAYGLNKVRYLFHKPCKCKILGQALPNFLLQTQPR